MKKKYIVGDKNKFAIQWQLENSDKHWRWGRFLLWVGGRSIGNWEDQGFIFNGRVSFLIDLSRRNPNIANSSLFKLSNEEILKDVIKPLYYPTGLMWEQVEPLEKIYRVHFLTELFQIDTAHLLYVENENLQRCVWLDVEGEQMGDIILPRGYIQMILKEFVESFQRQDSL